MARNPRVADELLRIVDAEAAADVHEDKACASDLTPCIGVTMDGALASQRWAIYSR